MGCGNVRGELWFLGMSSGGDVGEFVTWGEQVAGDSWWGVLLAGEFLAGSSRGVRPGSSRGWGCVVKVTARSV